jgi:hypothetical protein
MKAARLSAPGTGRLYLQEIFLVIISVSYGPVDDSASNRNEYQEYFLGVKKADA